MTAVAYTIINRANKRGLTPLQVVKQPHQYSGYSNPGSSVKRAMSDPQVRARVERIWNSVVTGSVPDPTNGGEYFHTTNISPGWSKGVNRNGTTTIGNHVFYKGRAPTVVAASPEVPPRRPDTPTALDAIQSLTGSDFPTATAYAPANGSLTTGPAIVPLPGMPARPAGAPPAARNALPPIPAGSAIDLPSLRADDVPSVNALPPSIDTIRATDLNPVYPAAPRGPTGRGRPTLPAPPPAPTPRLRLNGEPDLAWTLSDYAGNYVPTDDRVLFNPASVNKQPRASTPVGGLTTRTVRTVPVNPDGSVGPSLQDAANQEATRLRKQLPGVPALPGTFIDLGPPSLYDPNMVAFPAPRPQTLQPLGSDTLQPLPSPALRPLPTSGLQVAEDLTPKNLPPEFDTAYPFGYSDPNRLKPGVPLEPVGLPPSPPATPGAPGSIRTGALNAPLGALTQPGVPGFRITGNPPNPMPRKYGRVPPEEMVNPPPFVPQGVGPALPGGIRIADLTGPGPQLVGQMNSGKRPFLAALAQLFAPRVGFGETASSLSVAHRPDVSDYVSTSPAMPPPNGLTRAMAETMGYRDPRSL